MENGRDEIYAYVIIDRLLIAWESDFGVKVKYLKTFLNYFDISHIFSISVIFNMCFW